MLDLKLDRSGVQPKDAATLILVRNGEHGEHGEHARGVEVFCVERSKESRFMGGAIVFPGGKLDPRDADPAWAAHTTAPRPASFANDGAHLRALAIAACRETIEEAAILPVKGGALDDAELFALRARMNDDAGAMRAFLAERGLALDLGALHAFARWITPEAESRRYDARFFVAVAPPGQRGAHDEHETMASFWAAPSEVLRRFEAGEVELAPPTHRTLSMLASARGAEDVLALAARACLEPICPRLVRQSAGNNETLALVLPGDPEHDVRESRVPGESRYVLRDGRWRSEPPP